MSTHGSVSPVDRGPERGGRGGHPPALGAVFRAARLGSRPRHSSRPHARRALDEGERRAQAAFHSFCDRAGRGMFAELEDRDDLWCLLSTITARKVIAAIRHQSQSRSSRRRPRARPHATPRRRRRGLETSPRSWSQRASTPEAAASFAEREYARLFASLTQPDPQDHRPAEARRRKLPGDRGRARRLRPHGRPQARPDPPDLGRRAGSP